MFASAPLLVLKRKLLNRVVVCLFPLPMTLVFAYGRPTLSFAHSRRS